MKQYVYLVKRVSDGRLFVTYGNFKKAFNRPVYLYNFAPKNYEYKKATPFGEVYNISSDLKYNSKEFHVIRQVEI